MGTQKILFNIISIMIVPAYIYGQDPHFTQFYANPLYLNPALAGSKLCPRVCLNYRNEWPNISGTYVTSSASFDKMVYSMHGGIGFIATNDEAGQGTISTSTFSAIYSYHQPITRTFSIAAAMQATFEHKSVDWRKLNFGDQIDASHGFVKPTAEVQELNGKSNVDFSTGVVGYGERFFIGFAAHHLTQPNQSLFPGGFSPLPAKYTAHAGFTIPFGQRGNPDLILSPNIIWQKQQDFQELNLGIYLQHGPVIGGLWYRNGDAFVLLLGIEQGHFRIGYSYDFTISRLTNTTAGSHEISFSMGFACKKHKPHYRLVNCPSF